MNPRLSILLLTLFGLLAGVSCDEGDSIPNFIGRWGYDQASPPENVDSCYTGSWMYIYENNDFTVYDACSGEYADGRWESRGMNVDVWFEDNEFDDFQGKILSVDEEVMVLETAMFGTPTRVRFVRIGEAEYYLNTRAPALNTNGDALSNAATALNTRAAIFRPELHPGNSGNTSTSAPHSGNNLTTTSNE
ncbi:MAG: hypothetical protein ACLFN2_05420 [Bacteroidales bacterium]